MATNFTIVFQKKKNTHIYMQDKCALLFLVPVPEFLRSLATGRVTFLSKISLVELLIVTITCLCEGLIIFCLSKWFTINSHDNNTCFSFLVYNQIFSTSFPSLLCEFLHRHLLSLLSVPFLFIYS